MEVLEGKNKQKLLKVNFVKLLLLGSKRNLDHEKLEKGICGKNPFKMDFRIDVSKIPFEREIIELALIELLKEKKVSLKDLSKIGIPSSTIDYVSARTWFTDEEIEIIFSLSDDYLKAIIIIGRIYGEKMDRSGNPQSIHLISVSDAMKTREGKIVGLLHDVVEDGYLTLMSLLCLFRIRSRIVQAVNVLNRDKELYPTYDDYIRNRILPSRSLVVLDVKTADMLNNQSLKRVKDLPTEEAKQKALTKYKPYIPLVQARSLELRLERKRK